MADQNQRPAPPAASLTGDDRTVHWLLAHVDPPAPDAAFVRRLRDMLVRSSCPAI